MNLKEHPIETILCIITIISVITVILLHLTGDLMRSFGVGVSGGIGFVIAMSVEDMLRMGGEVIE